LLILVVYRLSAECVQIARAGLACAIVVRHVGVGEAYELEAVIGPHPRRQAQLEGAFEVSLPIHFGGVGVGDLVALADAAHVGAAGLAVGSAIRLLTTQDDCVRGDSSDEVPMEPTMYGRVAYAMTKTVSHRHGTPDGDDGNNEPMCSQELSWSWARCDAACGYHALSDSKPLITTALAILAPQCPTVARAGCVAEARSNNQQIARSRDGLPSLVPLSCLPRKSFRSYKQTSVRV
jgi:hypothetical protein